MYDVIIIGKGPAGISCAIYTVRAGLKTLVIGISGKGTLAKDYQIENYYGFEKPIGGIELLEAGERQAANLGVELFDAEVTSIEKYEKFVVKAMGQTFGSDAVLIATGQARKNAGIPDEGRFEGKGVSYCAVCDGFFYRGKPVVVVGDGEYALTEAEELKHLASKVTLLTNGTAPLFQTMDFEVFTEKISGIIGEEIVEGIALDNGTIVDANGLFVAVGTASATDFARKLGIEFEGLNIKVSKNGDTNFSGIFAAGDCVGGFRQISKSVGEGAIAGKQIIDFCRKLKQK